MRITRTSWMILAFGIFVITFISLGVARSQQLSEGQKLSDELAVAEARLSKLDLQTFYTQQAGLQEQLSQSTAQVEAARARLSQPNDSITISDALFRIAEDSGVQITQITSPGLMTGSLDKLGGSVLPLSTVATGEVPNLIDFVISLNSDLPIGFVKSVQIALPGAVTDNTSITTDNLTGVVTTASASIQLEVFAYPRG